MLVYRVFQAPLVIRVFQARMEKQEYKDALVRRDWSAIEASEGFREKEDSWDLKDLWVPEEKLDHKALMVSLYVIVIYLINCYYKTYERRSIKSTTNQVYD